jgi:hypothetical protein
MSKFRVVVEVEDRWLLADKEGQDDVRATVEWSLTHSHAEYGYFDVAKVTSVEVVPSDEVEPTAHGAECDPTTGICYYGSFDH